MTNGKPQPAFRFTLWTLTEGVHFAGGAIATIIALYQFYGGALTLLLVGVGLIVSAVHAVAQAEAVAWRTLPSRIWQNKIEFSAVVAGGLVVLAAGIAAWLGWMRVTFGRAVFTHEQYFLRSNWRLKSCFGGKNATSYG